MKRIAGVLLVLLIGCGEDKAVSPEESAYVSQMAALSWEQGALVSQFLAITNTGDYVDDADSLAALQSLLAAFQDHVRKLQDIRPPARLAPVHSKAIMATGRYSDAVALVSGRPSPVRSRLPETPGRTVLCLTHRLLVIVVETGHGIIEYETGDVLAVHSGFWLSK